jgi:hypothetical protein
MSATAHTTCKESLEPLISCVDLVQTSQGGSPLCEDPAEENIMVSVSTSFFPGAKHHVLPPDLVLLSSDSVLFYVHSHLLSDASENHFCALIPQAAAKDKANAFFVHVPESSSVLNIILHTVYDLSCAHYSPTFEALATAVRHLPNYGIPPKRSIAPKMPLFTLLLSHAPLFPLDLYALASSFDLYDLAASTSSHLLSLKLSSLTNETVLLMGPIYLKRLFFLHLGRSDALKRALLPLPHPHPPSAACDFTDQKKLKRAWTLASAYLAWDARPGMFPSVKLRLFIHLLKDMSTGMIEAALNPLAENLDCHLCRDSLHARIKDLVIQWSIVKVNECVPSP